MSFYAFCTLVFIAAAIVTWPQPAMKWCSHIISGLALFGTIVLWAIILDPGPVRATPPIGLVLLEDVE